MSITSDPALPYVQVGENKFGKLTPRDRAKLLAELKAKRRASLVANLKESETKGPDVFHTLNDFDSTLYGQAEWFEFVNSIDGQSEILLASLRKHHEDAETRIDSANIAGQELHLSAAVTGLEMRNADPNPPTATETDTPTPGQTYGS